MSNIQITKVNISSPLGCQIKDEDCKNEAYWFIEEKSVCEKHLKYMCKILGMDYDEIIKDVEKGIQDD